MCRLFDNDDPQPSIVTKIFSDDAVKRLVTAAGHREDSELSERLFTLGLLSVPEGEPLPEIRQEHRMRKRAMWVEYFEAADRVGMFSGPHAQDLMGRLRSKKSEDFRSAVCECMAAWYLADERGVALTPRPEGRGGKHLEFAVETNDQSIRVEVKAPRNVQGPGLYFGNDAPLLQRTLRDANKQFAASVPNLLVITSEFTIPVWAHPDQLVEAFLGKTVLKMAISKSSGGAVGEPWNEFQATGQFLETRFFEEPRFTRVSAVMVIEELDSIDRETIGHRAIVCHNPRAAVPIPEELFEGIRQLVRRGDSMEWID